jgi:hypothetical protein
MQTFDRLHDKFVFTINVWFGKFNAIISLIKNVGVLRVLKIHSNKLIDLTKIAVSLREEKESANKIDDITFCGIICLWKK